MDSPCYISDYTPNGSIFAYTRYVVANNPTYETIQESKLREFIKEDDAFLCRLTDGGYFVNEDNTFSLTIEPMKSDDSFEMIVNEDGVERKGGLPNAEQLAMFICANKLTPKIAPNQQSSQTQTTTIPTIKPLQLFDLFQRENDNKLYSLDGTDSGSYDVDDDELLTLKFESAKFLDVLEIPYNTLLEDINKGEMFHFGQVRVGDEFVGNVDTKYIVVEVEPTYIKYEIIELTTSTNFGYNSLLTESFVDMLLMNQCILTNRMNIDRAMLTNRNVPNVPKVAPKSLITDTEVDALKKDLSDLLFLKSGISDLEFEEKINISTEIFETQRKIDNLTEKLFEQRVGDENFFDRLFDQSFTPLKERYDMVIQKNDLPEVISPSGEISDLDEDMHQIINSNDFKEWFGDWRNAFFYRNLPDFGGLNVSKVLTDKFEPQIVWHGTNNEFSYFDFEMFPANYFAVSKEYSEFFAINKTIGGRGYVLPFFLDIKHPLDLSDFGNNYITTKDFFDWMFLMTGMSAEELQVNPMYLDPSYPPSPIWGYIRNNPTMLQKIAQGKVYDGIKFYEFNPNEENNPDKKAYETLAYIIFDTHQAKLADPNRGDIMLASLKSFMLKRGGKI